MKTIRSISPFLSFLLVLLMLAGSTCLTVIKHKCNICGQTEVMTSIELAARGDNCCCGHNPGHPSHNHNHEGFVFDNDCCSHEVGSVLTNEVVKTEVQKEIIPFLMVASIIAVIPQPASPLCFERATDEPWFRVHDPISFYCQILS